MNDYWNKNWEICRDELCWFDLTRFHTILVFWNVLGSIKPFVLPFISHLPPFLSPISPLIFTIVVDTYTCHVAFIYFTRHLTTSTTEKLATLFAIMEEEADLKKKKYGFFVFLFPFDITYTKNAKMLLGLSLPIAVCIRNSIFKRISAITAACWS